MSTPFVLDYFRVAEDSSDRPTNPNTELSPGDPGTRPEAITWRLEKDGPTLLFWEPDTEAWIEVTLGGGATIVNTDDLPEGAANFYFTDERAQDAVGNILDDGTLGQVVFTYVDGTPKIHATLESASVTNAQLANAAAWSLKLRNAGSSGAPSDAALADITTATPVAGDFAIGFLDTGEIRKFDVADFGGSGDSLLPAFVTPNDADYTSDNVTGSSSVTVNSNGSISLAAASAASVNVRARYKSISGSPPYTITGIFTFNHRLTVQHYGGLMVRQNDGKFVALILDGGNNLHVYKFNSTMSFSADAASLAIPAGRQIGLQIVDDNTDRIYRWSAEGFGWATLFSETRTTFITATQYGFMATDHNNTAGHFSITTLHSLTNV